MTEEEVAEKLKRYIYLYQEIEILLEELERAKSYRERMTQLLSDVPKGGGSDGTMLETATERIIEIETRIAGQVHQLTQERMETDEMISSINNQRMRMIMRMHYISGKTWEQIADALFMDIRWVFRMRKKAIKKLTIKSHKKPL